MPAALSDALQYYTPAMHEAAFQLPLFADRHFAGVREPTREKGAGGSSLTSIIVGFSLALSGIGVGILAGYALAKRR